MSKLVFDGETLITLIELNNKGYQDSSAVAAAIATAVNGLATDASVEAAIASAVDGLATNASVEAAIASATEGIATDASVASAIETAINGLATNASVASAIETAVDGLATNASVASAIATAVDGLATDASVASAIASATEGIATDASVEAAIASAINGLATDASVAAAIETAVAGLATDASVEAAIASATEGLVSDASLQEALADVSVDLSGYATDASVEAAIIAKGYQTASQVTTIANDTINGYVGGTGEVIVTGNVFIPAKDAVPTVQADYTSGTPAVRCFNDSSILNGGTASYGGLGKICHALLKNADKVKSWTDTATLSACNYVDKSITGYPASFNLHNTFILGYNDENHTKVVCGGSYQHGTFGMIGFMYELYGSDVNKIYEGYTNAKPTVTLTPNFTTGDKVWDKWYPLLKPKTDSSISWTATISTFIPYSGGPRIQKIYDVFFAINYTPIDENTNIANNNPQGTNQTLYNVLNQYATSYRDLLIPADMKAYSFTDDQLVHAYREGLDSYKEEMAEKLSMFEDVSLYDGKESIADPSISFEIYNGRSSGSGGSKLADHVANDASIAVVTIKWEDPYDETDMPSAFSFFDDEDTQGTIVYANTLNDNPGGYASPDAVLKVDGWNYAVNCHVPVSTNDGSDTFYAYLGSDEYNKDETTKTQLQYHIGEIAITTKNEYDDLVETVESITNAGYQTASDVSTAISTAMSSAFHMVTLSQAQYDELQVKAPNTLYIISD